MKSVTRRGHLKDQRPLQLWLDGWFLMHWVSESLPARRSDRERAEILNRQRVIASTDYRYFLNNVGQ